MPVLAYLEIKVTSEKTSCSVPCGAPCGAFFVPLKITYRRKYIFPSLNITEYNSIVDGI